MAQQSVHARSVAVRASAGARTTICGQARGRGHPSRPATVPVAVPWTTRPCDTCSQASRLPRLRECPDGIRRRALHSKQHRCRQSMQRTGSGWMCRMCCARAARLAGQMRRMIPHADTFTLGWQCPCMSLDRYAASQICVQAADPPYTHTGVSGRRACVRSI